MKRLSALFRVRKRKEKKPLERCRYSPYTHKAATNFPPLFLPLPCPPCCPRGSSKSGGIHLRYYPPPHYLLRSNRSYSHYLGNPLKYLRTNPKEISFHFDKKESRHFEMHHCENSNSGFCHLSSFYASFFLSFWSTFRANPKSKSSPALLLKTH